MGDQIISPCEDDPLASRPHHPHLTPAPLAQQSQAARDPTKPLGRSLCSGLSPRPGAPRRAGSLPSLRSRTGPSLERAFRLAAPPREPRLRLCFRLHCVQHLALYFLIYCLLLPPASKLSQSERPSVAVCPRLRVPGGSAGWTGWWQDPSARQP